MLHMFIQKSYLPHFLVKCYNGQGVLSFQNIYVEMKNKRREQRRTKQSHELVHVTSVEQKVSDS